MEACAENNIPLLILTDQIRTDVLWMDQFLKRI
jgi:hypothetical protein